MFDEMMDPALEAELCSQAAHVSAGECRLVLLIGEFDRRQAWAGQGLRSCAHWLNWRVGTGLGAAREQVRVGRALAGLDQVRSAFSSGELSYSKVRAITRVATAEIEGHLVELARHATASQLEQLVRQYRRADPDEAAAAEARHARRYVRSYVDDDGMVVISARLSPEDGAVVLAAIEAAKAALAERRHEEASAARDESRAPEDVSAETSSGEAPETPVPYEVATSSETTDRPEAADPWAADPWSAESAKAELDLEAPRDTMETREADALVALCSSVLTRGLSEELEEPHVAVVVHVDEQVLADPSAPGCAHVDGLGALAAHTATRLACDGAVSRVLFRADGSVEPQGSTRVVPRAMRRALLARDRGCRFPGCTARRFLHAHHVVFASRGGRTALSNLLVLCGAHHRLVHEGGWRLVLERSGALRVFTPAGAELPAVPRCAPADGEDLAARHDRLGLDIDADTAGYGGERFDLGLTVDALLCASGRTG